jgi:hypothetical protein
MWLRLGVGIGWINQRAHIQGCNLGVLFVESIAVSVASKAIDTSHIARTVVQKWMVIRNDL